MANCRLCLSIDLSIPICIILVRTFIVIIFPIVFALCNEIIRCLCLAYHFL